MTIKNKYLARLIAKAMHMKPYKVEFHYEDERYDPELTWLAFLNQNKARFQERADLFVEKLDEAIDGETNKTK